MRKYIADVDIAGKMYRFKVWASDRNEAISKIYDMSAKYYSEYEPVIEYLDEDV